MNQNWRKKTTYPTSTYQNTTKPTSVYSTVTKKKVELTPEMIEVQQQLIMMNQDRKFAPVDKFAYTKDVTIVTAGNGIFRVRKTPIAIFKTRMQEVSIPGLPHMQEGAEILIPKIPMKMIIQVLSFYRDVYDQDKTEACANFFWNYNNVPLPKMDGLLVDGQLVLHCPLQLNSSAETNFENGEHTRGEDIDWLRNNLAPLCESHSHHSMGAFWSGTDNANENYPQFYLVMGHIDKDDIQVEFRWCEGNKKVKESPSLLIEWPQLTQTIEKTKSTTTKESYTFFDTSLVPETIQTIVNEGGLERTTIEEPVITTKEIDYMGPFNHVEYPANWLTTQHKAERYYVQSFGAGYGSFVGGAKTQGSLFPEEYWDNYDYYGYKKKSQGLVKPNQDKNIAHDDQSDTFNDYTESQSYLTTDFFESYDELPLETKLDVDSILYSENTLDVEYDSENLTLINFTRSIFEEEKKDFLREFISLHTNL